VISVDKLFLLICDDIGLCILSLNMLV